VPAKPARSILWAEDNEGDRLLIKAALEDLPGAPRIQFADDGVLFLEALRTRRPDLAVLDLKMPRVGGLEALRTLRKEAAWRDLPTAVFSAGNQPEETAACEALGALAVVHKPVDFREFAKAVKRIVAMPVR
jgi:two-component system response regulator